MFTGIVQATARVAALEGGRLSVEPPDGAWPGDPIRAGESVAVDGCCLTAVADGDLTFDLSPETLARTTLGGLRPGRRVNLERAMTPASRFGGHLVQGHVDAAGSLAAVRPDGNSVVLTFRTPPTRYLVDKGSVAVAGVSLTVVSPRRDIHGADGAREFDVWTIPFTLAHTTLGDLAPGDPVNLEWDEIAKWVERLASPYAQTP